MNYQDYIKYDPEKKQYTDSYGYVIDGFSSKVLPTAGEAIAIANGAVATANAAAASIGTLSSGNFQTVTAGYGLNNQLAITTNNAGTATLTPSGTSSNIDVIINPKGLGIVDCKSYTAEWDTGTGSTQTLGTNVNTKVQFDNLMYSSFPAGFITESGGWDTWDTFQNTSGRTITLMVCASVRETTFPTGRTLGLWIARTGNSSLQYGQALLPPTTDTTNARALNTASIIRLANTESFSVWAHTVAAGVVIGGNGQTYNRPILSYRLMP